MRFKPVPEPPADLATVETLRRALPATAGDVDDCCAHLLEETHIADRDEAATWLTFLRALEIAAEEPAGFRRRKPNAGRDLGSSKGPDRGRLRRAFLERVDGADAVCAAVENADGPLTAAAVVETLSDEQVDDERRSRRNRFTEDRVQRLLEWAVLLGLAERADDGYRGAPAHE